jgi:hypothetical protein
MNFQPQSAEPTGVEATPSLVQRVIMVFTAPTGLGAVLRRSAPWFWTLAIAVIITVVILLVVPADVWQGTMEAQARGRPQSQEAPDPETMLTIARFGGAAWAGLMTFVSAIVTAGALYLTFNVIFGQDTRFKQHLSASAHVWWILLLGTLIVLPIWISNGDMLTKLGLGLLLQDAPDTFVGHLLNGFTLFGLWGGAALGAVESGLSGGRVPIGKAIGMVYVLYLIWVLAQAAAATLLGGLGG